MEAVPEEQASRSWVDPLLVLSGGGVLGIATWLEPAVGGHSTHTQLGLSPCTFLAITGIPCPMCGATTSFALMADGRWADAFVNQPFASLLFLGTVATVAVSLAEIVAPARRWIRLAEVVAPWEGRLAFGVLAAMIAGWTWKIALMMM